MIPNFFLIRLSTVLRYKKAPGHSDQGLLSYEASSKTESEICCYLLLNSR